MNREDARSVTPRELLVLAAIAVLCAVIGRLTWGWLPEYEAGPWVYCYTSRCVPPSMVPASLVEDIEIAGVGRDRGRIGIADRTRDAEADAR